MTILSIILLILIVITAIPIFKVIYAILEFTSQFDIAFLSWLCSFVGIIFVGFLSLLASYVLWGKVVGFFGGDLEYILQFLPFNGDTV